MARFDRLTIQGKICGLTATHILVEFDREQNLKLMEKRRTKLGDIVSVEMVDPRYITDEQRKKIFATIREISEDMGEPDSEITRAYMTFNFIKKMEEPKYFSLSSADPKFACDIATASAFLEFLIGHCLEYGVPTMDRLADRCEDIEQYCWMCLEHKKCAICGSEISETHHVDAIGMGNDRRATDDSKSRKVRLCRKHHTEAHNIGWTEFKKKYHIVGVMYVKEKENTK